MEFKKIIIVIIKIIITLSLLSIIIYKIGFDNILNTIKVVEIDKVYLIILCLFIIFLIGAFNIWVILRKLREIRFIKFLKIYFYGWAINLFMPGQFGDAYIIFEAKKNNISFSNCSIAYFIDKIISIIIFLSIALYGYFHLISENDIIIKVKSLKLMVMITIICLVAVISYLIYRRNKLKQKYNELKNDIIKLKENWHVIPINIVITIFKWIMMSLSYFVAFYSFNKFVTWPEISIIPIMANLIGYIPITISGIGTTELTAIYLFGKINIDVEIVTGVYILLRLIQMIIAISILSLFKILQKYEKK